MGNEVMLGRPLGGPLGGALGLRPAATAAAAAAPTLRVLLVGGGGAGFSRPDAGWTNRWGCPGGAGGQVIDVEIAAPALGAYAVTIGPGGTVRSLSAFGGVTSLGSLLSADGGGGGLGSFSGSGLEASHASGFNASGRIHAVGWPRSHGGYLGGDYASNFSTAAGGGGGGGSGGAGGNASLSTKGAPGPGRTSNISGVPVEYGRGGEGGHTIGEGATPANPGDGGGGAIPGASTGGSNGNAGILIISYETGTQTWTGGTVTQVGNRTIHTLTADGTLTRTA